MGDVRRAMFADELEMRGSPLCDCAGPVPPVSPTTGAPVAHRCGCAAVRASALIRRAASLTRHARECGCTDADREAALFWERELGRHPGSPPPPPRGS
ncbi:hypothetical protein [Spirillospora sp. NPDC029432]|uniref:hypothetical protein n=1 Tax=Spirillospora sp. NPDC029432 TaxID=3154599 RepID=UPI003451BBAC